MEHCLFYLPYRLTEANRARMVRPRKMIQAFRDIGYDVFAITGYAAERKAKIAEAKRMIRAGTSFEFMYSEANTEPTLLTQPHHYPTHPFLDYGFFSYVRRNGIPIGLFYPDVYWKFDFYGTELPKWKRFAAIECYKLDILAYEKYLNRFYVPSLPALDYLGSEKLRRVAETLPPGGEELPAVRRGPRDFAVRPLTLFYVGGLGAQYQITELLKAVRDVDGCRLILCCREDEWDREKETLSALLCDRVSVVHKSGGELEDCYREADIGSLLFYPGQYTKMAQPVKAYEYLAHGLPSFATEHTVFGDFIAQNGIGWAMPYRADAIAARLREILRNPALLDEKFSVCEEVRKEHTWKRRAEQVARGLSACARGK